MNSVDLCNRIKKTDLVIEKCILKNGKSIKNCLNFFRIDKKDSNNNMIEVNFSNNNNYYIEKASKDFFIPELDVKLRVLDITTAKHYKIKNYKNGLVVINNNSGTLREGDLIIEAEMNSIFKIKDLNDKIENLKSHNKKSILISLVREEQEKVVAVFLK